MREKGEQEGGGDAGTELSNKRHGGRSSRLEGGALRGGFKGRRVEKTRGRHKGGR